MNERRIPIFGQAGIVVTWDPSGHFVSTGQPGASAMLDLLEGGLRRGPGPLLEQVARISRGSFRTNFEMGGRPPWQPLKPGTQRQKAGQIAAGAIPRRTPTGRIPRRLLQFDPSTGQKGFGPGTKLIASGRLRDSWCVKGAAGNITRMDGDSVLVGSQLTTQRLLPHLARQRHYMLLTKKAQAARQRGQDVNVQIPLARIHEEGAPRANIPARPVGLLQPEDIDAINQAGIQWVLGG